MALCPSCTGFFPEPSEGVWLNAYIIYLQSEYDKEAYDKYRASMPWPAVPFRDARRASLQMGLGVKSIPALVA